MSAPRIIAGEWRGRRLQVPEGRNVRPTSERVREAYFNILGTRIRDACVLDLFAGSGAIGLEALSRGAFFSAFVERDREAIKAIDANQQLLDVKNSSKLVSSDAQRCSAIHLPNGRQQFDIVYIDPPYKDDVLVPALMNLANNGQITSSSVITTERASKHPVSIPSPFTILDERRYGAGTLTFLQFN